VNVILDNCGHLPRLERAAQFDRIAGECLR
jgi:hypothetical protein